jgi:CRP/FNR family transcriptional regulator, cyclic AMP receptor protein
MKTDMVTESQDAARLISDFIANIPMFDDLSIQELELLSERMNLVYLDAGDALFREWDMGDFVCFVESGTVEMLKKCGPDKYTVIATLGRGRSIGEMSIIDNSPRSATLKALTSVRIVTFSRPSFESLLVTHPGIGVKLLKGLARLLGHNLRKTSSRLSDYMLPMG